MKCTPFGRDVFLRQTSGAMHSRRDVALIALSAVVIAIFARSALHAATFGLPVSNDDAILLLMARHILKGEFATTLWNQPYNGALDAYLLAPFVGLFGTVLGIIKAFHDLAATQGTAGAGASTVMAGISEALVATAIGLLVAIPAVVAFNYFSRRVRVRMAEVDWMAHLAAEDVQSGWSRTDEQPLRRSA